MERSLSRRPVGCHPRYDEQCAYSAQSGGMVAPGRPLTIARQPPMAAVHRLASVDVATAAHACSRRSAYIGGRPGVAKAAAQQRIARAHIAAPSPAAAAGAAAAGAATGAVGVGAAAAAGAAGATGAGATGAGATGAATGATASGVVDSLLSSSPPKSPQPATTATKHDKKIVRIITISPFLRNQDPIPCRLPSTSRHAFAAPPWSPRSHDSVHLLG